MSNYRRNVVTGGCFFFTVNLNDRRTSLLTDHIIHLRQAVAKVKHTKPFHINAWVVLPDHMHCIWTLPNNDHDYSSRWRDIKGSFSRSLVTRDEIINASRQRKKERGIWQRRFWEHTIVNDHDYQAHMDYVYWNPVKHGWCQAVKDWPFSSFHRDVAAGLYPLDWCGPAGG